MLGGWGGRWVPPPLGSSPGGTPIVSSESRAAARACPPLLPRCVGAGGGFGAGRHPGARWQGPGSQPLCRSWLVAG